MNSSLAGLVDSLRKLASNLIARLRREHIELIDFEPLMNQLHVSYLLIKALQGSFERGCTLEGFLASAELESAVRKAAFQRINTLKEFLGATNESQARVSKSTIDDVAVVRQSQPEEESFKTQVKRQELHLASLEAKICELQTKAEDLKGRQHSQGDFQGCCNGPSLRSMWEELVKLEQVEEERSSFRSSASGSELKEVVVQRPKNSLLALFCRYYQCQRSLKKIIDVLRSNLDKMSKLKPQDGELFERSLVLSDSSSEQRQSALTQLLNKRSIASQENLHKASNLCEPTSNKNLCYPLRRQRTETHADRHVHCTGRECAIF